MPGSSGPASCSASPWPATVIRGCRPHGAAWAMLVPLGEGDIGNPPRVEILLCVPRDSACWPMRFAPRRMSEGEIICEREQTACKPASLSCLSIFASRLCASICQSSLFKYAGLAAPSSMRFCSASLRCSSFVACRRGLRECFVQEACKPARPRLCGDVGREATVLPPAALMS